MTQPIILVTGSTDGIGKATARELALHGAHVILHGRDREKGEAVVREIKNLTWNAELDLLVADVSEQENVRRLAEEVISNYDRLDVLINNAGTYERTRKLTADMIEMTFAVNYLAPFLLTRLLLPILRGSTSSRVINVASIAHRDVRSIDWDNLQGDKHYDAFEAYAQSKLADITFTYSLAERINGTGVTANCLHPGVIATKMLREGFPAIRGKSPNQAAKILLYLATSPDVAEVTGRYFEESLSPAHSSSLTYERQVQDRIWAVAENLVRDI